MKRLDRGRGPMRKGIGICSAVVLSLGTAGCFHYVPVDEVPPQGSAVRVTMSEPVPVELREITANRVVEIRGEVVTAAPDRLFLSAFAVVSNSDLERLADGETVILPRGLIEGIEQKRLSTTRTILATAAVVGLSFLVETVIRGSGGGEGDGPPPIIE